MSFGAGSSFTSCTDTGWAPSLYTCSRCFQDVPYFFLYKQSGVTWITLPLAYCEFEHLKVARRSMMPSNILVSIIESIRCPLVSISCSNLSAKTMLIGLFRIKAISAVVSIILSQIDFCSISLTELNKLTLLVMSTG